MQQFDYIIYVSECHVMQQLIFERPPPNVRKIVLATNIAEAGITINDIIFVVDCGKAKEAVYDALNNTPCLLPSWVSQASARQVSQVFSPSHSHNFLCLCNSSLPVFGIARLS